jgi:hypothetical protein
MPGVLRNYNIDIAVEPFSTAHPEEDHFVLKVNGQERVHLTQMGVDLLDKKFKRSPTPWFVLLGTSQYEELNKKFKCCDMAERLAHDYCPNY